MMSVKSWLILLVIYIAYLIIGGFLFNKTECPAEISKNRENDKKNRIVAANIINMKSRLNEVDTAVLDDILSHLKNDHLFKNQTDDALAKCSKWNFQNSLFFSFTVVTTIGYGHQATETDDGKLLCMAYAIIGVPLNAILIGALGSVFSNKFKQFKDKLWQGFGRGEGVEERPRVVVVMVEGLVFIVFFSSIFLLVPAAIFSALENNETGKWDYMDSVYYTFITLSTIGFGDMVPDRQENEKIPNEVGKMTYLVVIIIWIIFGMGYIFAVVDVISGTLKSTSKPVKKAFRGLKNQMQVNDYWRKIIGEIIVLKHGSSVGGDDSILVGGGGGSEPCLGEYEGTVNLAMRRAVSTGDIEDVVDDNSSTGGITGPAPAAAHMPLRRSGSLLVPSQSPNFLTVPGGHVKTRSASGDTAFVDENKKHAQEDSLSTFEELNEDTITSLRHFLTTARLAQPVEAWVENNMPGYGGDGDSLAPTRPISRTSLFQQVSRNSSFNQNHSHLNQRTVGGFGSTNEITAPTRRRSLQHKMNRRNSMKSTLSRQSTKSGTSSGTGGPIGALLEQTTLGEFLTAVENVRKKSTMEMDKLDVVVDGSKPGSRRSSIARRFSRRKTSKEAIVLPNQLASLFGVSDPSQASDIPLIQAGAEPSPTISGNIAHKDTLGHVTNGEVNGITVHM